MKETKVSFRSGELLLEGAISTPPGEGPFPTVLVCHPHPSFGGSMDNNVVMSICEVLFRKSIRSLRFNFRGVGKSKGHFSHGTGEQEDIKAAISFLIAEKQTNPHCLGLAGYSAGAIFSLPVAVADERVHALVAISLPLSMVDLDAVRAYPKPKMFVSGSEDDFTSVDEFTEFCQSCVEPKECAVIDGADHLWQGHEANLAKIVSDFLFHALSHG